MAQTAYKHISLTDDGWPVIEGTRFKIKNLVSEQLAHGLTPGELLDQHPQLTLAQIYSALAYYEDHREQIDNEIRRGQELADSLQPDLDSRKLKERIKERARH